MAPFLEDVPLNKLAKLRRLASWVHFASIADGLTGIGARDTCVSRNIFNMAFTYWILDMEDNQNRINGMSSLEHT